MFFEAKFFVVQIRPFFILSKYALQEKDEDANGTLRQRLLQPFPATYRAVRLLKP